MRNIQAQYHDLKEGRISQANFMRSVRMQFPQYISPVTSYDDSIKILKGKRILSEAKQPEGVYGHNPNAEAEKSRGIDHLNYYQVYHGIQYELSKMPEITDENYVKARKKVVDKILKDPDAYKELQLANYRAIKVMDEDLEMEEVKSNNLTDKPNEMKVVKKDEKGNTQDTLGKKEKKKAKNGKGVEHMTQTPKGKLQAFPTPGKERVLKENDQKYHEKTVVKGIRISVGYDNSSRDYTLYFPNIDLMNDEGVDDQVLRISNNEEDAKRYFERAVELAESGKNVYDIYKELEKQVRKELGEQKVQALKEHIVREMTTLNPTHEDFMEGMKVYKKKDGRIGQVVEFDGDTATVKWEDGSTEHVQRNVITKKEVQIEEAPPEPRDPYGEDPDLDIAADPEVPEQGMTEDRKAKLESLKEKLTKAVKELLYRDKKTQRVQSFSPTDPAIRDPQFTQVFQKA